MFNVNDVHPCGICGSVTMTLQGGACVECKARISDQIKRNLEMAHLFTIEMIARYSPEDGAKLFTHPAYKHNHTEDK